MRPGRAAPRRARGTRVPPAGRARSREAPHPLLEAAERFAERLSRRQQIGVRAGTVANGLLRSLGALEVVDHDCDEQIDDDEDRHHDEAHEEEPGMGPAWQYG